MDTIIKHVRILSDDRWIEDGFIQIKEQKIEIVAAMEAFVEPITPYHEIDGSTYSHVKAVPGFIDFHTHGGYGADTMDATAEAFNTLEKSLPQEGITSFLPTTMTQPITDIEKTLEFIGNYIGQSTNQVGAEILGLHLEGPFINPDMAGAQPKEHILLPEVDLFKNWQQLSNNQIKVVTIAPEQEAGLDLIRYLKSQQIVPSAGHSNASYQLMQQAIDAGMKQVTHLFNQMSGLHHREPGVVGACFLNDELKAELIADGVHVVPEMVRLTMNQKTSDQVILITDSIRAKGLPEGSYDLGGQPVDVTNGKARLVDGRLAGSILRMDQAVRNVMKFTDLSLKDAVKMASQNPAKQLNLSDRKGSIAEGKDADIVILNGQNEVLYTICRGQIAYNRLEEDL